MKKIGFWIVAALAASSTLFAQTPTFPRNGVYDERPEMYAFTNATVYVDAKTVIENTTLFIKSGIVVAVGNDVQLPNGTVIIDLKGKRIYPSLIDLESDYGMPQIQRTQRSGFFDGVPQLESNKKGAFGWNQAINAEIEAGKTFTVNSLKAEELRKLGFGSVLTHQHDGIVRGTGALVTLANERENSVIVKSPVSAHFSLSRGSSSQSYPNSPMGAVALLRQTYYDAEWYKASGKNIEINQSLEAFNSLLGLPTIFETTDKWALLRADKVGEEFKKQYIFVATGDEYQRIDEVKSAGGSLIVNLNFPQAFDVEDPWDADNVSLAEMKHWEMAPANAAMLEKAGINFALSATKLKTTADFWTNLRKAIENGLSETKALEALTTIPAQLIDCGDKLGSLKTGMWANFIITSGNLFSADNIIYENWIRGKKYSVNILNQPDVRGNYELKIDDKISKLVITGKIEKPEYQIVTNDTVKITPKVNLTNELIAISFQADKKNPNLTRLSGYREGSNLKGNGEDQNGKIINWEATLKEPFKMPEAKKDSTKKTMPMIGTLLYPFVGFGNTEKPKSETILIKNVTVWTSEVAGNLEDTDVLVENGKISKIGKNLAATNALTIDGKGKHLTPGIIDEHSHIAIASTNEAGQSSTAEVRMSDVIVPDDINIYRQLAGGVTTSQLLHGSANAIGGQSAVVKLKWGGNVADMLLPEAQFIKFALGENVKQSSRTEATSIRFPKSRMGVEQVYFDHFMRAKEYDRSWASYNSLKNKIGMPAPRRDIELDALVEILNGKRFITCHSYVQSEINMLIKVADSLGFKVNTFTHILEGYKVADKMKKHGAAGSSFADWWAYKMEVKDAIPYNAAIMSKVGVVTSINSDDAEMARRLNQEAAKTVEYGGILETEALKMVTINPAKMLHLDQRTGSIKVGKDADLVLWNNHPLSIYARPDYTIVEGTIYYSTEKDEKRRVEIDKERARLIQKMISAKTGGSTAVKPTFRRQRMWHCEDVEGIFAEGEEGK